MVTGKTPGHEEWARVAVRCFLEQTYPAEHRELVIINDGEYRINASSDWTDSTGRLLVREISMPPGRYKLGDLRNIGIEESWGNYIIQWDDDDWHGPSRMEVQAAPLASDRSRTCTFLNRQLRYSFTRNSAKTFTTNRIHGTILHRKCSIRYPSLGMMEDTGFMQKYITSYGLDAIVDIDVPREECDQLYIRFHHGDDENTWPSAHVMGLSSIMPGTWRITQRAAVRLRRVLKEYYGLETGPGVAPRRRTATSEPSPALSPTSGRSSG
jgi:glycosyltransferase involved in cell wall biosynthesis